MIVVMRSLRVVVIALGLSLVAATGCTGADDGVGGACGTGFDAESGTVGDFGADATAQKVEALLHASADLYSASAEVEADVLGACTAMASDLGIPASELAPANGELAVTAACKRVAQEVDSIIATLPAGVALGISVTPASCTVDLDLAASCAAECDASIQGDAMVECHGELHGSCSGSCSGSCAVEGSASCTGECSGTCSGSCSGTCTGTCSGTCSAKDSEGNCVGTCSGTCMGTCSATCSGSCSGTCVADVSGSCTGECYGSCDATWDAECNGDANVTANAECKAACDARANAHASCDPPTVTIVGVAVADPSAAERVNALVETLRTNYPKIVRAQSRVQLAIAPAASSFVTALRAASTSLATAGLQATACMAAALDAAVDAAAGIDASVSVSVMVTASVSASGSAN